MPITVLMVDDDDFALRLGSAVLEKEGVRVLTVTTWPKFNHIFYSEKIDLALIDAQMPSLRGEQLIKILKTTATGRRTPLVLLSSLPEDQLRELSEKADATGWVQKPLTTSKARELLRKYVPPL